MKVKSLLSTGLGALALGLMTTAAQAGPSGLAGAFDQSAGRSGLAEKVTWYGDGYKGYYGHYHRPYYGYRWYGHRHYGYRGYGHRHFGWYPRYGYRHW